MSNRVLIVAHPDDEVIWFDPYIYDRIIIVYTYREDRPDIVKGRLKMQEKHPLKNKIEYLDFFETNFWRDPKKEGEYKKQFRELTNWIRLNVNIKDTITTHDSNGEYGHSDHILVNKAVVSAHLGDIKFSNRDKAGHKKLRESIKQLYKKYGCWTWES